MPGNSSYATLATDGTSTAIAAWFQGTPNPFGLWGSHYNVSFGWTRPVQLDESNPVSHFKVGMDSRGDAIVVWRESKGGRWDVRARMYDGATGWANYTTQLSDGSSNATLADLSVAPSGEAAVAWQQLSGSRIAAWVARFSPADGWLPAEPVGSGINETATSTAISTADSGNLSLVWTTDRGRVWTSRFVPGAGWSAPALLYTASGSGYVQLSITHDGSEDVVLVFSPYDDFYYRRLVRAVRYDRSTGWGAVALIDGYFRSHSYEHMVAQDSRGRTTVAWFKINGSGVEVWLSQFDPSSGWGNATRIAGSDSSAAWVGSLSADEGGNVTLLYTQDGVRSLHFRPGVGWKGPVLVSRPGTATSAGPLSEGRALALWLVYDPVQTTLWWSQFEPDTTPPVLAVASPSSGALTELPYIEVRGSTETGSAVEVNGLRLGVAPNGSFHGFVPLSPGPNLLRIVAMDMWGNPAEVRVNVTSRDVVAELREILTAISGQLNVTQAELARRRTELDTALAALSAAEASLAVTEQRLNQTTAQLDVATLEVAALRSEIDHLQLATVHLSSDLSETAADLEATRASLAAAEAALQNASASLAAVERERRDALSALAALRVELNVTLAALEATRGDLSWADAALGNASAEVAALENQRAAYEAAIEESHLREAAQTEARTREAAAAQAGALVIFAVGASIGASLGIALTRRRPRIPA